MATEVNAVAPVMAAIYVGDLDVSVTEDELRRLFEQIGEVISVKICMDQFAERSLGYGYVNYRNPQDAAKAIERLNFTPLNGKIIRISHSIKNASLRKSGAGNIFIKNLDKAIDHKELHEIFSSFGNIISYKVETDASGQSKGYGFVHYDSEDSAQNAIEQLNGTLLHGKEVYVGPFISKQEREKAEKAKFTNVFVKNLSEQTTDEDLKTRFGEFGSITSVAVIGDEDGNSKCFGFVNFENIEDAAKSVEELNGQTFDGKEWYVGRAQKKSERERELKIRHEQIAKEALERSLRLNNLYVKNLNDEIDDDKLKDLFSPFGSITSCKVMYDTKGISKGSGFVAFPTSQEASRAISEMNGKMVGNKPLYVAIAETKEVRKERLQALFSNMCPNTILPPIIPHMPMYPPGGPVLGQQFFYGHAPPAILPPAHAHAPPAIFPSAPGFGYQQNFVPGVRPSGTLVQHRSQDPRLGSRRPDFDVLQQPFPMMHQQMLIRGNSYRLPPGYGMYNVSAQATTGGVLSVPQEISPSPAHDRRMHRPNPVGPLASTLANASLPEQRNALGEKLYPLVEKLEHDMAAKVTGMLLEMDKTEVLHLLESPESLRVKVVEAMEVLRNEHHQQASNQAEQVASLVLDE